MLILLTVLTFIICISIDYLGRKKARGESVHEYPKLAMLGATLTLPPGRLMSMGHLWLSIKPTGEVTLGVDELIKRVVGRVDQVTLEEPGNKISRGEPIAAIRKGTKSFCLLSPVDGIVVTTNPEMQRDPDLFSRVPSESLWISVVGSARLPSDLLDFVAGGNVSLWWLTEVDRLEAFLVQNRMPGLSDQDASRIWASPTDGLLELLDQEATERFQSEFLKQGPAYL